MLEHACHLPRSRRHTCNRHYRLAIDLQNLIRTIVDNGITGCRTTISRNQNPAGKLEGKDRRRLGWLPDLLWCRVLPYRTDSSRAEQAFPSQQRRKVIPCTREVLVKSQL